MYLIIIWLSVIYIIATFLIATFVFRSETFCNKPEVSTSPIQRLRLNQFLVHVFGDLDLWPIFYLSHKLCMKYWSVHAKFHKNSSSINGWYGSDVHFMMCSLLNLFDMCVVHMYAVHMYAVHIYLFQFISSSCSLTGQWYDTSVSEYPQHINMQQSRYDLINITISI